MAVRDDLGVRMKTFYEQIPKTKLMRRTPVAIRIDGKAFHTFTRGFQKPFDEILMKTMQETTKYLCENIQGCVLGYTQSDEITLILIDYQKFTSAAWFDYEVQKICSISASMATMAFNKVFARNVREYELEDMCSFSPQCVEIQQKQQEYIDTLKRTVDKGAMFDARCFNIPKEEVTNLIYWRQLDASRNSIQMVGQANFSHKDLHNKSCNMIQDMLMTQKGINWNDFPTYQKRGSCCVKVDYDFENPNKLGDYNVTRSHWVIDKNIPIFKGDGRAYVESLINVEN